MRRPAARGGATGIAKSPLASFGPMPMTWSAHGVGIAQKWHMGGEPQSKIVSRSTIPVPLHNTSRAACPVTADDPAAVPPVMMGATAIVGVGVAHMPPPKTRSGTHATHFPLLSQAPWFVPPPDGRQYSPSAHVGVLVGGSVGAGVLVGVVVGVTVAVSGGTRAKWKETESNETLPPFSATAKN